MRIPRRSVLVLIGLGSLAVVGCGRSAPSDPPTGPSAAPPTDLRSRLVGGLRAQDPTTADLVGEAATTLTPVPTAWLPGWVVVDATNSRLAHPRRVFAAVAEDGRALVLTGDRDAFRAMVRAAGTEVGDASTAVAVATTCFDVTRDFRQYTYRVASFADVGLVPHPTPAERAEGYRLAHRFGSRITAPVARRAAAGWVLTVWSVDGRDLVEHAVRVDDDGSVHDTPTTRARDIPGPVSV